MGVLAVRISTEAIMKMHTRDIKGATWKKMQDLHYHLLPSTVSLNREY